MEALERGSVYLIETDVLLPQPLQPLVGELLQLPRRIHQLGQAPVEHLGRVVGGHKVQESGV